MTTFQLKWRNPDTNVFHLSRHFASEMPGPMVASMLETDMKGLGEVVVSRDAMDETTNCIGSVNYRITFVGRRDYVPLMSVENMVYQTTSQGGTHTIARTQLSTYLGGSFTLSMPVVRHEGNGKHCESIRVGVENCDDPILQPLETTRLLRWNITEAEMEYEIQRNIWYIHDRNKTTLPVDFYNEWTMAITPLYMNDHNIDILQAITEPAGVAVVQGASSGVLKTALNGGITSVVITAAAGVVFVENADMIVGGDEWTLTFTTPESITENGAFKIEKLK